MVWRSALRLSKRLLVGVVVYLAEGDGSGNALRLACQLPGSIDEFSFPISSPEVIPTAKPPPNPLRTMLGLCWLPDSQRSMRLTLTSPHASAIVMSLLGFALFGGP